MTNTQNINKLLIKETLIKQVLLFEITLNEYVYETQNLFSIVNAAMLRKIHTSVFYVKIMITELKEIKKNLPMGVVFLMMNRTFSRTL